jgi:hypothetical protein
MSVIRQGKRARGLGFLLVLLGGLAPGAWGEEYHFGMIFGSESTPKRLKYTHTWATFIKAVGTGTDPANYQLYVHTISWYPASRKVRVWNPFPEEGVNLTLEETLAEVYKNGESVTMWGPFLIRKDVYDRSLAIVNLAATGAAKYRAISTSTNMLVADCIHAVAAVDAQFGRSHYPLIRIGKPASRYMAREVMIRSLQDGFRADLYDFSWLIPRLGLNRYPIEVIPPRLIPYERCVCCKTPP